MSQAQENVNTIIIGAGPAGLAVAASLKKNGISNYILEQNSNVASTWRKHYDRLHLHTDKKNSELPYMSYPANYPRYMSRDQLVGYLETYARTLELDIRLDQQVLNVKNDGQKWIAQTQDAVHTAPNLVVATGYARSPIRPAWKGMESFKGTILHSSEYKNGAPFKGQRVLVVGFGNSGGEIAIDLFEHGAKPSLAVRNAVNVIPRELAGIPILSIGIVQNLMPAWLADAVNAPILRMVIGDIKKLGLQKLPYGPATQIKNDKRIPLIDIGTIKLIKEGKVTVYQGIKEFSGSRISFDGGKEAEFDAVICATGYQPRVDQFLKDFHQTVDENGTPTSTGKEAQVKGLYFCGYYVSPTGMLREMALEARSIASLISAKKV